MNNLLTQLTPILYAIGEITKAALRVACIVLIIRVLKKP